MSDLENLFDKARRDTPAPSAALEARVLADALRLQPPPRAPQGSSGLPAAPVMPGFWAQLAGWFGGAGALAGMVTAGFAGLAAGYLQPAGLAGLTTLLLTDAAVAEAPVELMPGLDALLPEE